MKKYKAVLIPAIITAPVQVVETEDTSEALARLVFGELYPKQDEIDFGFFSRFGVQLVFDDFGLLRPELPPINHRAMRLWAMLRSMDVQDFHAPLRGNFVLLGVDPAGETVDVPADLMKQVVES